jgi:hypothetical protein
MSSPSRFCTQCGVQLSPSSRFCHQCGAPVRSVPPQLVAQPAPQTGPTYTPPVQVVPQPSYAPPPYVQQVAPSSQPAEPILSITTGLSRSQGFLGMGRATFTMVLTPSRMVFAHLSTKAMNQLVADARDEAKADGKGVFKQWAAQMSWLNLLLARYQSMTVDQILAQDPESFFIPNATVSRVRVQRIQHHSDPNSSSSSEERTRLTIETTAGKHRFDVRTSLSLTHRQLKQRLERALGAIVR